MLQEIHPLSSRLTLLIVGILATFCLVFNLAAIPITREQWILNPGILFPVGWIIMAGFMVILLFNGFSAIRALFRLLAKKAVPLDALFLTGGILCILLLGGEKVMLDEIARETRFGLGASGEWIVLYTGLAVQLCYNLFAVFYLIRSIRAVP
jgi:hypothetical protein